MSLELPVGYEIREMSDAEIGPFFDLHAETIFDDSQIFRLRQFLSEDEKAKMKALGALFGSRFTLNLGLFYKDEFVGWCAGQQESAETYYMRNSVILPAHRRKGLYQALMQRTVEIVSEKGFQKIYSRHNATNNSVIIPKLKFGFTIGSLEISDIFGVLVHLVYFPKEIRRKMMVYRVGDMKPDDEIKKGLDIK